MQNLFHHIALASPLFVLVLIGYALVRWGKWPATLAETLTRFVFVLALPALLFRMMSGFSQLPPVDERLLIAFFGGCFAVFLLGRLIARHLFGLDGVAGSIFSLGGVFSNNVLLGLPLAKVTLGEAALPSVALVLVFNSLILWTLVTVSVEWARHGSFSLQGFAKTARSVITNPIVAAILGGTLYGLSGLPLPQMIDAPLAMIATAAAPMALLALGMGLATYPVRQDWHLSVSICVMKLIVQPLAVWLIARALGLPTMETQVVVLLASIAVGANVYLMARQFNALEGPVAASLVLSTALAALTTPLALTLTA
ncbi:MAG: AEC family transporter [Rhodocyclaceae bacterium]